jgi:hypothetical protein
MSNETLESILTATAIPSAYWPEMRELVFDGARPSKELLRRLNHVGNYMTALRFILATLSAQVEFKFPPKNPSSRKSNRAPYWQF